MLPVLGLGNLALMTNRFNSEFSPNLNTCISTTLERHSSILVELQEERYISLGYFKNEEHDFATRSVEFYFQKQVKLEFLLDYYYTV